MRAAVREELERIRISNGGALRPEDIVEAAASKDNPLHPHFEWDDSEAAARYRLLQASHLIRVCVIVDETIDAPVRAFVSLMPDRATGVGYRAYADVVNDPEMLRQLIADAQRELDSFARKFARLRQSGELAGVFGEIDKLGLGVERKSRKRPQQVPAAA